MTEADACLGTGNVGSLRPGAGRCNDLDVVRADDRWGCVRWCELRGACSVWTSVYRAGQPVTEAGRRAGTRQALTTTAHSTATLPPAVPYLLVQVCEELFTDITCPLDAAARAAMGVSYDGGGRLYYEVRHRTAARGARALSLPPRSISDNPLRVSPAL